MTFYANVVDVMFVSTQLFVFVYFAENIHRFAGVAVGLARYCDPMLRRESNTSVIFIKSCLLLWLKDLCI